jgi:S-DNA-T family DNA segregation ATPase FtsK/SpoIIIE
MMQRQELEMQADRLELVLREYKAPARVTGGNVTPRWIQFLLQTAPGIKVKRVESLSREIALALGASAARVSTQGGAVRVEVPRPDPQPVKLLRLCGRLPPIPLGTAVLGLAEDGAPLLLRLPSPDVAHVLIAGTTGSGKTALVQTMIVSLALGHRRSQLQLVLIDPKGRAFEQLSELPHLLKPIVGEVEQAVQVLDELVQVMEARDRSRLTEPQIVIVLDEIADLVQTGGREVLDKLGRLVQRGREAGLHVIGATQKPSSSVLGSLVKANFPVRLVGRVVSSEDARVAAGIGGTQAERLTGHGDFLAVAGPGVTRFQAAYISAGEMASVARRLARGQRGRDILQTLALESSGRSEHSSDWDGSATDESAVSLREAVRALRRVK